MRKRHLPDSKVQLDLRKVMKDFGSGISITLTIFEEKFGLSGLDYLISPFRLLYDDNL